MKQSSLKIWIYKLKRSSLRREFYTAKAIKIFSLLVVFFTFVYIYCDYNKISFRKMEPVDCTCPVHENLK